ncbi:MAG: PhzF family phenazine biosynthesis protein [Trueperaceae bacterium]|nr:PhzF family phenazine biosynthesis protein [Trueperaceae bacterium]
MPRRATPPPTRYAYQLWDVFTDTRLSGNPLAVLPDAQGLSGETMQALAQEFNLSETSFLLPSKSADVHARYFTPHQELPMAGHPSIGSVYALEHLGRAGGDELVLKLAIGPVTMRLERGDEGLERVWMDQGVPSFGQRYPNRAKVAALLNLEETDLDPALPVQEVSAGVPFVIVAVNSLGALGHARLTETSLAALMGDEPRAILVVTRHVGSDKGGVTRRRGCARGCSA